MAEPAPPVAEVSVAAPAVAQAIVAGVMTGVSCGHKETPCNTGTVKNMTRIWTKLTSEKLQILSSLVWWNKCTISVKLISFLVNFQATRAHATLHTQTLKHEG